MLERSGHPEKAIDKYLEGIHLAQRAGAVGPAVPALHNRLADAYVKTHDWTSALAAFEEIRAMSPEDERAQFFLTELYLRVGQREQGERELEALLGRNLKAPNKTRAILAALARGLPNDVPLNLRLARAYVSSGQKDKAVEGLDTLGDRLLNSGEREAAIQVIREIIALNPPRAEDYRKVLAELGATA